MNGTRFAPRILIAFFLMVMILLLPGCSKSAGGSEPGQPSTATEAEQAGQQTPAQPAGDADGTERKSGEAPEATSALLSAGTSREGAAPRPLPPPPPRQVTLGDGTEIVVRTVSRISTKTNQPGQSFQATLEHPLVQDDWVIAKKGADVEGILTDCDPGGRVQGVAHLGVQLRRLTLADGRTLDIRTSVIRKQARTTKKKDAQKIGIGAGIGAAVGAIAGGGKGAGIGAAIGGGAGSGLVLASHGEPATIASETKLTFRLADPVQIVEHR